MKQELLLFLKTYDFRKGTLFATLGFLSFGTGRFLFPDSAMGIAMAMGILLSAISDVPGTRKHNLIGIATGIVLATISFSLVHLTKHNLWLLGTTISVLVFFNAYICVYGLRASMVSFSGLLGIALGFVNVGPENHFYYATGAIVAGGGIYVSISTLINLIKPRHIAEQLVIECMQLTAEYLRIRAKLPVTKHRESLLKRLLELQITINEKHESLRALVLHKSSRAMGSGYYRRLLLIFIELVDILELAIANPVNYDDIDYRFEKQPEVLEPFTNLLNASADLLVALSYKITGAAIEGKSKELRTCLKEIQESIEQYKSSTNDANRRDTVLLLRNLADYEESQVQKIETIEHLIADDFSAENIKDPLEPKKFITTQDYSLKRLRDNFNVDSIVFKHALRLMLCVISGFSIGTVFHFKNTYWILITILVIMRPNYGITKLRTMQRVYGTLIGTAVSFVIIYLTTNVYVYAGITFTAMIFAFAYIQQNYMRAAAFITINIVFVFAMLSTNPFGIISSRIIDTLMGAGLAMLFNYFFWPVWEAQTIAKILAGSLLANKNYIKEIGNLYITKNKTLTNYKLSRKLAFIQMGNLHAAFQRMAQEPKSKQVKLNELYDIIILQHTFLSASAALGTYIQAHKTTEASEHFKAYLDGIVSKINNCEEILSGTFKGQKTCVEIQEAQRHLSAIYKDLLHTREQEVASGQIQISEKLRENLKEIKLIHDQLNHLFNLTEKLEQKIISYSLQT